MRCHRKEEKRNNWSVHVHVQVRMRMDYRDWTSYRCMHLGKKLGVGGIGLGGILYTCLL